MMKYKVLSTKKLDTSLRNLANANGIEITEQEAIRIKPAIDQEQLKNLVDNKLTNHVIFTSANAVEIVAGLLQQSGIQPDWKIFCIEGKTRQVVQQLFPGSTILATAYYGKDLAKKILDHGLSEVHFFSGNIRRDELPEILNKGGINFHESIVYETILTPVKISETYDAIVFFSPSSVESFFSMNDIGANTLCFSIGETTADSIKTFTRNNIIISKLPSQEKIIEELINYFCTELNQESKTK